MLTFLRLSCLYLCTQVSYITFNTDLNLYCKKKNLLVSTKCTSLYMSHIMSWLLLSECEKEHVLIFIIHIEPNIANVFHLSCKFSKIILRVISGTLTFYIFSMSLTPATCTICLIILQIWCHTYVKRVPHWLPIILIILSNDVHLNSGPQFQNNFLNFMPWNVNSLA